MIGHTISHYTIIEKLGEGGMGVVYKAHDSRLDRTVALKFLPFFQTHDEQNRKRFLQEARAVAALNHPNIATVYEIDKADDQYFIVMEFYQGNTLQGKILEKSLTIRDALLIALKIANGLHKAHSKNIIHRDVKPANIIFSEDDEVKIIDFGLAKLADQSMLTVSGTTMGTVSYMSPEQLEGAGVDHRTDIWALGVLLYEMLSGERPFAGQFAQAIMYSITNEEPEYISKVRPEVPLQIESIINKALQKNPEKRFENMEEMEAALQEALEEMDSGVSHPRSGFKLGRKQKKAVYITSVMMLLLALIAAFFLHSPKVHEQPVSIALLPLDDLSVNASQEWFSDGMTDALITDLARISGIRIISRSSVTRYKGTDRTASEIAAELGVDYVIEGTVLESGNQVRISIRLIDAQKDGYLWGEVYNHDLKNILQLQGEVAKAIAAQIEVQLTPFERNLLTDRKDINPKAYEAYLKGNYHRWQLSEEALDKAKDYYEMAIEMDPDFAPAYSGVAFTYLSRAQSGYVSLNDIIEPAEIALQKALKIDSTIPEIHNMLAVFNAWVYWNWQKADEEYARAIELNPNYSEARAVYSHLLFILKREDEALYHIEEALKMDPYNPLFQAMYSMDLMYLKRYDEVIARMEKNLETSPGNRVSLATLRSAYHQKGMHEEAIDIWRKTFEENNDPEAKEVLTNSYQRDGYEAALKNVAELYIRRSKKEYVTPWQIATLYARAGMKSESLDYLEKAFDDNDLNMPYISVDPIFDYMRDDPRFIDLIKKLNLL
ncbi:protein kinase [Balneolaceae bacterium YR4-1]|uniref:non-specific serine/threonine protein kinase n=1 Tax=Halalkalibaculum roseum TaxID=2709311 RepID=A0A6M1SX28_9BACT|nr:protein kinase [Halalkalibaculum roseum]NGP75097.1 protein kinase [Halalkalibaculum roseum]